MTTSQAANPLGMTDGRDARVVMLDLLATVPYYTAYLSRALLGEGLDLTVAAIDYYLDPACFSSRGIHLRPGLLNVVGRHALPPLPRRLLKLAELGINLAALTIRYLVRPPEILHIQFLPLLRWRAPLDLWFIQLCRRRGSRLVLTVHDLLPHDTADRYRETFHQLYRGMDGLICHSESIKARLVREFDVPEQKINVIPHGPFFYDLPANEDADRSTRERLGIPADRAIVLWQGIIFPYKGLDLLLQAWGTVERTFPAGHLLVVGTGSPEMLAQVRGLAAQLNLQRVTLDLRFATTEELVATYRAAEVVVYPYRAITTSGALATGLALGKAIVATDLPVFREVLEDGINASLTPAGDVEALAQAVILLLSDVALRTSFEDRVRAMHFGAESWKAIADKTLAVYRSLLPVRAEF